jgi:hypothetical protein
LQVPAKLVSVAVMPRLPNGKIDVKALAEPEWGAGGSSAEGGGEAAAPSTDMEELLTDIWAAELKVCLINSVRLLGLAVLGELFSAGLQACV